MPLAAASSLVTAPLVTVSVDVAHLEQRIVAIWGMDEVDDEAEKFRFKEPIVDVEDEEPPEEIEEGDDGPAIVVDWIDIYVCVLCAVEEWCSESSGYRELRVQNGE